MNELMFKLLEVLNEIELLCNDLKVDDVINVNENEIIKLNKEFYFNLCNSLGLDINYFINK